MLFPKPIASDRCHTKVFVQNQTNSHLLPYQFLCLITSVGLSNFSIVFVKFL